MAKKKQRGKEGNAVSYITRNQALTRLQIKLPEFRRLCILKGIHPREPKKKVHGHNKTYYHLKDINFLAHEPLLDTGREIKAHERKVKKARGRLDEALLERLKGVRPAYTLDHLVKERYPTFLDALRDLDDALTLLHLFATLPADTTHQIPADRVHTARRLSLEWHAYITRTHSLRKVFVSVKGTYYQAEVWGQKITWLVPHPLTQEIPSDVDFRVMLTFLEFYETLISFVNFKLYHELGLAYPPVLDPKLEEAAAELYAVMKDLAGKVRAEGKAKEEAAQKVPQLEAAENTAEAEPAGDKTAAPTGAPAVSQPTAQEQHQKAVHADTAVRLASLQNRLAAMAEGGREGGEEGGEDGAMVTEGAEMGEDAGEDADDDEETRRCRQVFKGLVFFLAREVPRESLLFVIRSFGGTASWEGEGAPIPENDESITHQVVDRPSQKHRHLSRDYVQPQWVVDCANVRVLLPTAEYGPGRVPPPHLSPFVDNEAEGYTPEYAEAIQRYKQSQEAAANGVAALPGTEEEHEEMDARAEAALRSEDAAEAARLAELAAQENVFRDGILKEVEGIPYSASLQAGATGRKEGQGEDEDEEKDEEEEEEDEQAEAAERSAEDAGSRRKVADGATEADDEAAMARIMMPRKTKKLYEAMQMGRAKKKANVALLEERKRKAKATPLKSKRMKE